LRSVRNARLQYESSGRNALWNCRHEDEQEHLVPQVPAFGQDRGARDREQGCVHELRRDLAFVSSGRDFLGCGQIRTDPASKGIVFSDWKRRHNFPGRGHFRTVSDTAVVGRVQKRMVVTYPTGILAERCRLENCNSSLDFDLEQSHENEKR
jgi:hypothetical protein